MVCRWTCVRGAAYHPCNVEGATSREFGIFHEFSSLAGRSDADAFAEAFEIVGSAERWGLDAIWLAKLHFNPGRSVPSSPHVHRKYNCRANAAHEDWRRGAGAAAVQSAAYRGGSRDGGSGEPGAADFRGWP